MLDSISQYGYPDDYLVKRIAQLQAIKQDELHTLADKYIHPDHMAILVVGDAKIVKGGLAELGYGPVIDLDIDGNPLPGEATP